MSNTMFTKDFTSSAPTTIEKTAGLNEKLVHLLKQLSQYDNVKDAVSTFYHQLEKAQKTLANTVNDDKDKKSQAIDAKTSDIQDAYTTPVKNLRQLLLDLLTVKEKEQLLAADENTRHATLQMTKILYAALIELALYRPLNTIDEKTRQPIQPENRVVIASGRQFDIRQLVLHHNTRKSFLNQNGLFEHPNDKYLLTYENTRFSHLDLLHLISEATNKNLRFTVLESQTDNLKLLEPIQEDEEDFDNEHMQHKARAATKQKQINLLYFLACVHDMAGAIHYLFNRYDKECQVATDFINISAEMGSLTIIRFFHSKQIKLHVENQKGQTPLYSAMKYDQYDVIDLFGSLGIVPHAPDNKGHVLLESAAQNNDVIMIAKALDHGTDPNVKLFPQGTIAHVALEYKSLPFLEALENTGRVNFLLRNSQQKTIYDYARQLDYKGDDRIRLLKSVSRMMLHSAAEQGSSGFILDHIGKFSLDLMKPLKDLSPDDTNPPDKNNITPLYKAIRNGRLIVLNYYQNELKISPNDYIHRAARIDDAKMIAKLAECKYDFEFRTKDNGWTGMHIAASFGYVNFMRAWHEQKLDIYIRSTKLNETPLDVAIRFKQKKAICFYAEIEPDFFITDKNYRLLFHTMLAMDLDKNLSETTQAFLRTNKKIVLEEFTKFIKSLDATAQKETLTSVMSGNNVLSVFMLPPTGKFHGADSSDQFAVFVKNLRACGMNSNPSDANDMTPFYSAVRNKKQRIIDFYKKECKLSFDTTNELGDALAHVAVHNDDLKMIAVLADEKGALDAKNDAGETALHAASASGNLPAVSVLLNKKADPLAKDRSHRSPLYLAAKHHTKIIKETKVSDEKNKLTTVVMTAQNVILNEFKKHGIAFDSKEVSLDLMHTAASLNDIEALFLFELLAVDLKACDAQGNTAAHIAAREGSEQFFRSIVGLKTDLFYSVSDEKTKQIPLDFAFSNKHDNIIQVYAEDPEFFSTIKSLHRWDLMVRMLLNENAKLLSANTKTQLYSAKKELSDVFIYLMDKADPVKQRELYLAVDKPNSLLGIIFHHTATVFEEPVIKKLKEKYGRLLLVHEDPVAQSARGVHPNLRP